MKTLFVIIMCLCFNVSYAQKPDTTKTSIQAKELDEVLSRHLILPARMIIFLQFLQKSSVNML